jgi:hypothetical protein
VPETQLLGFITIADGYISTSVDVQEIFDTGVVVSSMARDAALDTNDLS